MDKREQIIRYLLARLQETYRAMLISKTALQAVSEHYPGVEATVQNARSSPYVQTAVDRFFSGFPELLDQLAGANQDQALRTMLAKLEMKGKPN